MKKNWKLPLAVIVLVAGAAGLALNTWTRAQVAGVLKQLSQLTSEAHQDRPDKSWVESSVARTNAPWDRTVTLAADQIKALGVQTVAVKKQTDPWPLRLTGMTDYDPATVTVVRTQFDSRVEKVLVGLGSTVKVDDPLLELFSTVLAEAKSNYEMAVSQWTRDKRVLDYKTPLATENVLARKELIEVENDEGKSRLAMKLAKDKLLVYGLNEKEIEASKSEDGVQKARTTSRETTTPSARDRSVILAFCTPSSDLDASISFSFKP